MRFSAIPCLGCVEVNLQIPGINGNNEDVLLLVILTTTYSEKVLVLVRSKIIYWAIGMMTKGELARATVTWKQAYFGAAMSGLFQLPCTTSKEEEGGGRRLLPPHALILQHPGSFAWMMFGDLFVSPRRLPFPCLGLLASMETQVPGDTACRSMCLLNQPEAYNCLLPWYKLPPVGSCTQALGTTSGPLNFSACSTFLKKKRKQ